MNLIVLQEAVKQFRRTETRALRSQGLTLQEIARLFGVSHQRVWSLLKDEPAFGEEADAG
jgi:transcriptional regulator with XRE-family HTH domain